MQDAMFMHAMTGEVQSLEAWQQAFASEQGGVDAFPEWAAEVLVQVVQDEVSGEWEEVF